MKKLSALFILLVAALGFSQNQGVLKGTVLDQEMQNEPLLFANVQLKELDLKTETNFHGSFEFDNLKSGKYTLVVSYAGYNNIEMPIRIKADEIVQLNLGMAAKQISFDGIEGIALSSIQNGAIVTSQQLPRK